MAEQRPVLCGRDEGAVATGSATEQRIDVLCQLIVRQQAQLDQLATRLAALADERCKGVLSKSAARLTPAPPEADEDSAARDGPRAARRALLKTVGAGTVAVFGAGLLAAKDTLAGTAGRAEAANGQALTIGQTNSGSATTVLQPDAGTSPDILLSVDNSASGSTSTGAAGVQGNGPANTNGLLGQSNGAAGYGVLGQSDQGYGVVGSSGSGIDLYTAGTGRLLQRLQPGVGAPTTGSYAAGEQVRDANGDLWLCVAGGAPGTWKKAAALTPGYRGGVLSFLAAPIRLLDTRTSPGAPYPAGSTNTLQVTGVAVGGIMVPAGAAGVIGNLTVTAAQGGGYLTLYPADAQRPNASSINYVAGSTLGNGVSVGLSAAGRLAIYTAGAATHVIFDASGFVL